VVPCFQQAHFLAEALDSVRQQTRAAAEVIVVDDGSTDDIDAVLNAYPEVRVIRQQNRGLSAARNTGLRNATGEFVLFLDADDRLLPRAIEAGAGALSKRPGCAFAYGRFRYFGAGGTVTPRKPRLVSEDPFTAMLAQNYIAMHATVVYRRDVLLACGGFDERLKACEDYDVYLRLSRDHPIAAHDEFVAEYRQHDESMSRDPVRMLRSVFTVLDAQRPFITSPERQRAFRSGRIRWQQWYARRVLKSSPLDALRYSVLNPKAMLLWLVPGIGRRVARRWRRWRDRKIDFGSFRRLTPISDDFGADRGTPIDRYYIEAFLQRNAAGIRGNVLEIGDDHYTKTYGSGVTRADVLNIDPSPNATIVADLADGDVIRSGQFDCVIVTQTLQYVLDVEKAVATLARIVKPGGVVLATVPGITQLSRDEWADLWCWSFTPLSARKLFERHFGAVIVEAHGNVLTSVSFLEGVPSAALTEAELAQHDPQYPMLITVRCR
jgi:glycosyltransferase involved in cell wall biosynthesis